MTMMTSDNTTPTELKDDEHVITHQDLVRSAVNVGALGMEFSWTYANQMGIAFCLMIMKMLKKIYRDDPEGYAKALERHVVFFNITPQIAPFVGGIAISMEEKIAKGELEPESVNEVKAALMGPLSGIGDSIFLTCIRIVAVALGISLCQSGNPLGPIVYLLIYNVPAFWLRIWGVQKGYEVGVDLLTGAEKSGLMDVIMQIAGIVGCMVIGSMTKDMFWATISVEFGIGDAATTLQDVLDGIMPGIVGLGFMGIYYWLLSKKISPVWLILGTMAFGVIAAFFGFME
jgi:fructoselysine and glucoselysine-specific PTS system IID component